MNRILRRGLCALSLAGLAAFAATSYAAPFADLVIFGDSVSDTGNNAAVFDSGLVPGIPSGTRTDVPISGPDFIPTLPYASDRYSNGSVWVDSFAAALGLDATASSLGGTNFAYGGARIGSHPLAPLALSLQDQVAAYLAMSGGIASADTLYVLAGGSNDVRDAIDLALLGGDPNPTIAGYVSGMAALVADLVNVGARQILLWTIPDLGLTPAVLLAGGGASASLLSDQVNAALLGAVASLPLPAEVDLDVLDLASLLRSVVADPTALGFDNVTSACAFDLACIADPAGAMFWDGVHPTSATHAVLARGALAAVGIPEPATLALVLLAFAALVVAQRARWKPARIPLLGR